MADTHSKKIRSKNMAAITSKDTKPEIIVRRALHNSGLRYGLHNKNLPGTPDLHLKKYNAVIFVNGCFWHVHDCHYFKMPSSNTEYWENKFEKNVERDKSNYKILADLDKRVCIVWECAVKGKNKIELEEIVSQITEWLNSDIQFFEISGNKCAY